jgi:hypothetical protein
MKGNTNCIIGWNITINGPTFHSMSYIPIQQSVIDYVNQIKHRAKIDVIDVTLTPVFNKEIQ